MTLSVNAHSGYEFSWNPIELIPKINPSSYHDFHHTRNVGNYGSSFPFWDMVCGTKKTYDKYLQGQKEGEKKKQ